MSVILAKWGNAIGVRIPSYLIKQADLHPGDQVELKMLDTGEIVLKPIPKKDSLEQLLEGIHEENYFPETEWWYGRRNDAW